MSSGFGIERLGLVALRYPWATLLIILALLPTLFLIGGKPAFNSDIREIFRSGTPEFATLDEVEKQYPGSDRDALLVIEGDNLFKPAVLAKLRDFQLDLNFVDGVTDVLSMFSARRAPQGKDIGSGLFPNDLEHLTPEQAEVLKKKAEAHPLIGNKLLSKDGRTAMMVVTLGEASKDTKELQTIVDNIRTTADEDLKGTGLTVRPTGLAVLRVEIIGALIRDQGRFSLIALTLGFGLCWFFFRKFSFMILAGLPAAIAIGLLLGIMGVMGKDINVLTNVLPTLVMVLVFSDALHLLFSIRRHIEDGANLHDAIETAVRRVGPACVMTSLTTTLALLSLLVVPHPFIKEFGSIAALGTALALVATMMVVPALASIILKRFAANPGVEKRDIVRRGIDSACDGVARAVLAWPKAIALIGLAITGGAAALYAQTEPHYSYLDNLPQDNPAYQAIIEMNDKIAGPDTMKLFIQWPQDHDMSAPDTMQLITQAHKLMQSEPVIQAVSSLYNVQQWLQSGGSGGPGLQALLGSGDNTMMNKLVSLKGKSALVTAYMPNLDASKLVPILDDLDAKIDKLRKAHPDVKMAITGLAPLSARSSYQMIFQLNLSLILAIAVIIILIAVSVRSVRAGLVSVLPNLMPIAIAGAGLYLFGKGLQFTSVVAFTIGFGMAVDSTIHFLNRFNLARQEMMSSREAIGDAIRHIGPVVIVSTVILAAGLGATISSSLPMIRLYGTITVTVLLLSVVGAIVFLPAILMVVEGWRRPKTADETRAGADTKPAGQTSGS